MLGELCQPSGAGPEFFHKFMMNASMEMAKSNRRKQSKPNRLLADEELRTTPGALFTESKLAKDLPMQWRKDVEPMETNREDKDPMDLSTKSAESPAADVMSPKQTSTASGEEQLEMVNFPCHMCDEMFPSRAQQEQHISERHSSEGSKVAPSPPGTVFPTSYHQLATELGLGHLTSGSVASTVKSAEKIKTSGSLPSLGTPGVGGKGSAGTVFQREAYCDLCQREFCNKYFLKTHKANIHGIVDPNDSKSAVLMAKVNQSVKTSVSPHREPVQSSQQRVPPSTPLTSTKTSSASESMEDFCEICQKHFCNKYYLKKHKMDVHNIRPDGNKSSSVPGDAGMDARSMPLVPSASSSAMPSLPMMVPPLNSLNPTSMNNMLFVNPFVPSMAAMSMVPPMMQPPFFMPGMSNLAAAQQALSNVSPPQIKNEPKPSSMPSANLERGESLPDSEVKAEGFCDICRKEFCNSYFLQIHRANKHGIFDEATASAAFMMSMANPDQKDAADGQMTKNSTSPVSSTASNTIRPVVIKNEQKERQQTSPAFSVQSTPSSKYDSPSAASLIPPALSFDAMLAAKQADRIMCDICNKEVCNKYFLKAHKLKMHGVVSPGDEKTVPFAKDMKKEGNNFQPPMPTLTMQQQPPLPTLQAMCSQPSQLPPTSQMSSAPGDSKPFGHNQLIKQGIDPEAYCFLCKKEFCSKYFLKTHKVNMHGVKAEGEGQRVTPKGTITPPTSVSPMSAASPAQAPTPASTADTFHWKWKESRGKAKVTANNAANEMGADMAAMRWKEPANATRVFCDICNKELCNKYFLRTHKLKMHGVIDNGEQQGMQASNMMVDLARASSQDKTSPKSTNGFNRRPSPIGQTQSTSPTELDMQATLRDDVCQVCGMVFANKMVVEEHFRVEHADVLFETPKSMVSDEVKVVEKTYNCSQCSFKTLTCEKLASHEARKHNPQINTCTSCNVTFSHVHMLIKHMKDIHQEETTLARLQMAAQQRNGSQASKQPVKSRHIKFANNGKGRRLIKRREKAIRTSPSHFRIYACDKCSYTCSTIRNLRFHQAMKHKTRALKESNGKQTNSTPSDTVMQRFNINSLAGTDSIAMETVTLPVYRPVDEETRINLILTPAKS